MAQRPSRTLTLLAAGAAAGAMGVAAVKHIILPTPEQQIFTQMVSIFNETLAAQQAEREDRARQLKADQASQHERMKQAASILDTEIMRLEMTLPALERDQRPADPASCALEWRTNESYMSLDKNIRDFDDEIKNGHRSGKALRTPKKSDEHRQVLSRYTALLQQKCN